MPDRRVQFQVYFPPDIMADIEAVTERGERSAWIVEACKEKLARGRKRMEEDEAGSMGSRPGRMPNLP